MSLTHIAKSEIDALLLIEDAMIKAAGRHGLKLHRSNAGLQRRLISMAPMSFAAIKSNLTTLTQDLLTCTSENIDPWDDHKFLTLSMRSLKLSFPKDFLDHLGSDELLEGYDGNRMQIFRNMRFMERSNYSLLEILSSDWPQLFDRAAAITEKMITFCDETLWIKNQTIAFDVPKHYMRELKTQEHGLFEVEFKHLAPLFSGPDRPFGILGSSRVRAVELSNHRDNLAFV